MVPFAFWLQAAAILDSHELNLLLEAIAGLWSTIVLLATILWGIGKYWVSNVQKRLTALENAWAIVPATIRDEIRKHEVDDQRRHDELRDQIQRHADIVTATMGAVQIDAQKAASERDAIRDRLSAVEDTPLHDRRRKPR